MADAPRSRLVFDPDGCPDCGRRLADVPGPLPPVGDDIDLTARDFDGLRRHMLEDLAARRPGRTRWSPADLDVVLVEALAAALDELSDMADRVAAEAYLATARRPSTVRQLLGLIGVDAVDEALAAGSLPVTSEEVRSAGDESEALEVAAAYLDRHWLRHPDEMDAARAEGPRRIREQRRMVTVSDYAERMEDHPLVERATSWTSWSGTWARMHTAVVLVEDLELDDEVPESLVERIRPFHHRWGLVAPAPSEAATVRMLLHSYAEHLRMTAVEVVLQDVVRVPLAVAISVQVSSSHFRSEVRRELRRRLGGGPEGLFHPAAWPFGHDVQASDIVEAATAIDGVENVCINRLKRRGRRFPDRSGSGVVVLRGLEIPSLGPSDGGLRISVHGGMAG